MHLQLQSGKQAILAFAYVYVQFKQSPLQWHLTSLWLTLETSGILIQTGTHILENLVKKTPHMKE